MQIKENLSDYIFKLTLVYLCLYFIELFGFPDLLMLLSGAVLCVGFLITQKRVPIHPGLCLIALTMYSYCIIVWGPKGAVIMMTYIPILICILSEYLGAYIGQTQNKETGFSKALLTLIIGFSIHGILNSYLYFAGYNEPGRRFWMDIWNKMMLAGTHHSAYFVPVMALIVPCVIYFKEKKWKTVLVFVVVTFFSYTSLVTKSRMPILILILVFIAQILLYAFLEMEKTKKLLKDRRTWIGVAIISVMLFFAFLSVKDTAVVSAFIENLSEDGGILNNARFVAQRKAILQLFEYPMGGRQMDLFPLKNFCHNTWLDMTNAAGIIPFFAFTLYTIYSLYQMILLVRNQSVTTELKLTAVGVFIVFFLYFTVEPALDASVHFLTPWVFLNGMVHGYLSKV